MACSAIPDSHVQLDVTVQRAVAIGDQGVQVSCSRPAQLRVVDKVKVHGVTELRQLRALRSSGRKQLWKPKRLRGTRLRPPASWRGSSQPRRHCIRAAACVRTGRVRPAARRRYAHRTRRENRLLARGEPAEQQSPSTKEKHRRRICRVAVHNSCTARVSALPSWQRRAE